MTGQSAADGRPHDLVIGGSGMLSLLCERLTSSGRVVCVIARNITRLQHLVDRVSGPGQIVPVAVDYRDMSALAHNLDRVANDHGRPARIVCWVHDEIAPDAPLQIAEYAGGCFWQILSSYAGDPARPEILASWRERFRRDRPGLDYRQIVLGFIAQTEKRSRWLTDAEICGGVEMAIESDRPLSIVGTVDPRSEKPQ